MFYKLTRLRCKPVQVQYEPAFMSCSCRVNRSCQELSPLILSLMVHVTNYLIMIPLSITFVWLFKNIHTFDGLLHSLPLSLTHSLNLSLPYTQINKHMPTFVLLCNYYSHHPNSSSTCVGFTSNVHKFWWWYYIFFFLSLTHTHTYIYVFVLLCCYYYSYHTLMCVCVCYYILLLFLSHNNSNLCV